MSQPQPELQPQPQPLPPQPNNRMMMSRMTSQEVLLQELQNITISFLRAQYYRSRSERGREAARRYPSYTMTKSVYALQAKEYANGAE